MKWQSEIKDDRIANPMKAAALVAVTNLKANSIGTSLEQTWVKSDSDKS